MQAKLSIVFQDAALVSGHLTGRFRLGQRAAAERRATEWNRIHNVKKFYF